MKNDLQHRSRREELAGWPVTIVSYQLGDIWHCTISNADPGANIARGHGATREEAESYAIGNATVRLGSVVRRDTTQDAG